MEGKLIISNGGGVQFSTVQDSFFGKIFSLFGFFSS